MSEALHGCRYLRVSQLEANGARKAAPVWIGITTPQEAAVEPQYEEGAESELRGGDGLLVLIKKPDKIKAVNLTFRDAKLNADFAAAIAGGTVAGTKYTAPTLEESKSVPPCEVELYVAAYEGAGGAQVAGYVCFLFPFVRGRIPGLTAADRQFAVPSFTLRCSANPTLGLPVYQWDRVDRLPG